MLNHLWELLTLTYYLLMLHFWMHNTDPNVDAIYFRCIGGLMILTSLACLQFFSLIFTDTSVQVQMIYSMCHAVVSWLVVFGTFFLAPFATFLYVVFDLGSQQGRHAVPPGYEHIITAFFNTFYLLLGAYDDTETLYTDLSEQSEALELFVHTIVLVFGILILTNLVIAMLTTRYDEIRERSEVTAQLNYAELLGQLDRLQHGIFGYSGPAIDWIEFEGLNHPLKCQRDSVPASLVGQSHATPLEAPVPDSTRLTEINNKMNLLSRDLDRMDKEHTESLREIHAMIAKSVAIMEKR